jgi:aspartate/methionine/tyrosine aminotransferase
VEELVDLVGLERLRSLELGYGSVQGSIALRRAVGAACGTPAEHVLTTQGTALALFLLAFEVCGPDSDIVLATPCFPPARETLQACGSRVRTVPLSFDAGYQLDPGRVSAVLGPATQLVSIASPQNPSRVRVANDAIHELLRLMRKRAPRALLFIDETYREATYGDDPIPISAASIDARIVTGGSVSKAQGAPGLRVGWLTIADAALRERLTVAKMNVTISGSPLDEALATAILQHGDRILAPRRRMLAEALAITRSWLDSEHRRIEWVAPEAGALCCMRLRSDMFDDAAVNRFWGALEPHALQLAPGDWFGEESRVLRLGFGFLEPDRLPAALGAVSRALNSL